MGELNAVLISFMASLQRKADAINTLMKDVESMKNGLKNQKPYSRQTIEPMTRLRKSKAELEESKENPDAQFIKDSVNDILGS